jgi:hypothetical protein
MKYRIALLMAASVLVLPGCQKRDSLKAQPERSGHSLDSQAPSHEDPRLSKPSAEYYRLK